MSSKEGEEKKQQQQPSTRKPTKEELRMNLKARIEASSIRRMNKHSKEMKLNELQDQIKEKFGHDVDINKLMQQMNVSKK